MSFYFAFDSAVLDAGEEARIGDFMPWLTRNADVTVAVVGEHPWRSGVQAVEDALLARGLAANRIEAVSLLNSGSTEATPDAGTGDQGGDAAVGADQSREAKIG